MPAHHLVALTLALGWLAAVLSCFISTPQLVRMMRSGSVAGVSRLSWQLTLGGNLTWGLYGLRHGNPNQWLPNVLLIGCTLVILSLFHKHVGTSWLVLVAPGLVIGLTTVGLDASFGAVAFSVAAFLPSAVSQASQAWSTATSDDVTGISMTNQVLGLVNQSLWLVWALLIGESSVLMVGSAALALLLMNFALTSLRKSGRMGAVELPLAVRLG